MSISSKLMGAAAVSVCLSTQAGSVTVSAESYPALGAKADSLESLVIAGLYGQTRFIPTSNDNQAGAQIYSVYGDFKRSCMVAGGGADEKHAYEPAAQDISPDATSLGRFFDASIPSDLTIDLKDRKFNAPYIQYVENEERAFFRIQMGFPINTADIGVDGKLITVTSDMVEKSGFTIKITDPELVASLKEAYLQEQPIQVKGLSKHKTDQPTTVMAYEFQAKGSNLSRDFNDCIQKLPSARIPLNELVTFTTSPMPHFEMSSANISAVLGNQCLRNIKPEDVAEVRRLETTTGFISAFDTVVKLENGQEIIADYLAKDPDGHIRLSASWQQLENHVANSCTPPREVRQTPPMAWLPPVDVPYTPVVYIPPYTPVPPTRPPVVECFGCGVVVTPPTTPNPPPTSPVPIWPTGVLLGSAIGGLLARRKIVAGVKSVLSLSHM